MRVAKLADIDVPEGLIASAREGSESARARLYRALAPSAFGLIRRLVGTRAIAEDLFQDTMMTVYEHLDDYRAEGPFGGWVRRIAVSKCLMYLRSPWHRARIEIGARGERSDLGAESVLEREPGELRGAVTPAPRAECLDVERALARAHRRLREWFEPKDVRQSCTTLIP
ncbi:MAG: RNA polymerase sigma factor [Steroidobacteraceae bacterium]